MTWWVPLENDTGRYNMVLTYRNVFPRRWGKSTLPLMIWPRLIEGTWINIPSWFTSWSDILGVGITLFNCASNRWKHHAIVLLVAWACGHRLCLILNSLVASLMLGKYLSLFRCRLIVGSPKSACLSIKLGYKSLLHVTNRHLYLVLNGGREKNTET